MTDEAKREANERVETTPIDSRTPTAAVPLVADRFEILGLLGIGGMASVYRAHDRKLDEIVALKVMSRELGTDEHALDRFRSEVRLARRVTHRNVARSYDIGEHEGQLFLTMELVEGESLAERLGRLGRLPEDAVIAIARDVCAGLEAAHTAGIVHRDLKPANVLLAQDGRVVLTDFGIASATLDRERKQTVGIVVGTPEYLAPEQIEGRRDLDGRADLYALGAMMFELVTGTAAWNEETVLATVMARMKTPPPDPRSRAAVSDALAEMILACMAQRRDDRPRSARDAIELLDGVQRRSIPVPSAPRSAARGGVVVLTRGATAADDRVANGLGDLIERHLRGGTNVRVLAVPPSARAVDASAAASRLHAAFRMDVAVRVTESRMSVETRLVRMDDGVAVAANKYDAATAELFALAGQIARDVADRLGVRHRPTLPSGPTDPRSIDLWLRARSEATRGAAAARDNAVVLFEQATTCTPDEPWILASYATTLVARFRASGTSSDDLRESHAMAEDVLRQSPVLGEAWLARSFARFELGRPIEALHDLGRARRTMSAFAQVHAMLGRILSDVGESARAEHHLARAILLDASVTEAHVDQIEHAMLTHAPDVVSRAMAVARQHEDSCDAWLLAARACLWRRDVEGARALARALQRTAPLAWHARARAVLAAAEGRDVAGAISLFEWLAESDPGAARRAASQRVIAAEIAACHGDLPHALDAFEGATATAGFCALAWADSCVLLDPARASPRFKALRARVEVTAREVRAAMEGSGFEDE